MIYKDQLNRSIEIKNTPKRIVSLVPSQTELLVSLGLTKSIVGITKFCVNPKNLREDKTIVGGTKTINLKKIKTLNPDIILCNKEENTPEIVNSLNDIAPIYTSDIYNIEGVYELMIHFGQIFKVENKAMHLINNIKTQRQAFQSYKNHNATKKAAYFIWKNPWMVAASNTFIDAMLIEAGFENVFKPETRYPEISLQNEHLQNTDVILLSSEPFPFKVKDVQELKNKFPDKKVFIVDGEMFSWFGSRLEHSYQYFKTIHN